MTHITIYNVSRTTPPFIRIDSMKLCGPIANDDILESYHSEVGNPHPKIGDFSIMLSALSHIYVLYVNVISFFNTSSITYTASSLFSNPLPLKTTNT